LPPAIFLTIASDNLNGNSNNYDSANRNSNYKGAASDSYPNHRIQSSKLSSDYGQEKTSNNFSYSSGIDSDNYSTKGGGKYRSEISPFSKTYATNQINIPKSESLSDQQNKYPEASKSDYDSAQSKSNPAAIYTSQEPSYSVKEGNQEFRIAIIAADTSDAGEKAAAESKLKESKVVIPLSKVESPMGSVSITPRK